MFHDSFTKGKPQSLIVSVFRCVPKIAKSDD